MSGKERVLNKLNKFNANTIIEANKLYESFSEEITLYNFYKILEA